MVVKIVTDSTSDISPEVAKALNITIVPTYVHFDVDVPPHPVTANHTDRDFRRN